jgi:beta-galactosidase
VQHEKAAADPAVRAGYLPMGVAWYRKVFAVPAEWDGRRVRLDFDGVMRDAHVWVNGSFVGSHYSGYTGFSLDVTEFLRYGDEGSNVVLVRTDTTSQEGWWAEGGGIYRHVWLVSTHPVHIARHGASWRLRPLTVALAANVQPPSRFTPRSTTTAPCRSRRSRALDSPRRAR